MESTHSREYIYALQQREANDEQLPIRTVSYGLVSLTPLDLLFEGNRINRIQYEYLKNVSMAYFLL